MDTLLKRTSIRRYQDAPVEAAKIEQILRAAMAAPSGGNQQPWEFYVVSDSAVIRTLAGCSPYAGCAAGAPVVLVPCYRTEGVRFPELVEMDLSNATENALLAVTALGLGGVWLAVAPYADRVQTVDTVLGLGEGLHAFALIPVGYPAEQKDREDRYDPRRVHYLK